MYLDSWTRKETHERMIDDLKKNVLYENLLYLFFAKHDAGQKRSRWYTHAAEVKCVLNLLFLYVL